MHNKNFYKDLPEVNLPLDTLLPNPFPHFQEIPEDWVIVVTDITNSTRAVQTGRYQEVNVAAASSVVATVNLARHHNTTIPFVFGGDGATMIIPAEMASDTAKALTSLQEYVHKGFGLELRTGLVPVKAVSRKHPVLVSKTSVAPGYTQAVFLNEGLSYAETLVKRNPKYRVESIGETKFLDLSGLQCRWQEIGTPQNKEEIICLLVQSTNEQTQNELYGKVLNIITDIYGSYSERHPVQPQMLRPTTSLAHLRNESLVSMGRISKRKTARQMLTALADTVYFRANKSYLERVVAATDTLKIDGMLKTMMAGSGEQRQHLLGELKDLEKKNELRFGHNVTTGSVMTCFVNDFKTHHWHFLDGVGGGYTKAAQEFKQKF